MSCRCTARACCVPTNSQHSVPQAFGEYVVIGVRARAAACARNSLFASRYRHGCGHECAPTDTYGLHWP